MRIYTDLHDSQVLRHLEHDRVGVIPTDTIYGLACVAESEVAVAKLYTLKPRDLKPGTVIAANVDQIVGLGVQRRYVKAVEHLWPNPISIILPCKAVASYLDKGRLSLPFRIPDNEGLRNLLLAAGPLLTTSANDPDCLPSMTVQGAVNYFHERVDFYVDGGDLTGSRPSTIIRVVDDTIEVLRQGAVLVNEATGQLLL